MGNGCNINHRVKNRRNYYYYDHFPLPILNETRCISGFYICWISFCIQHYSTDFLISYFILHTINKNNITSSLEDAHRAYDYNWKVESRQSRWNELWDDLLTIITIIIIIFPSSVLRSLSSHFHGDDLYFLQFSIGIGTPIIIIIILDTIAKLTIRRHSPYITHFCKSMDRLDLRWCFFLYSEKNNYIQKLLSVFCGFNF